jgi:hypothetical protein
MKMDRKLMVRSGWMLVLAATTIACAVESEEPRSTSDEATAVEGAADSEEGEDNTPICLACDPVPPEPDCDKQDAFGEGGCQLFFGYKWNGTSCEGVSGCNCVGADCKSLWQDLGACNKAHDGCTPSVSDDCASWAAQLTDLLDQARACNLLSMQAAIPCDGTTVPNLAGCPVPVANKSSDATQKYLTLYAQYAAKCPQPDSPCFGGSGDPVVCGEDENVGDAWGTCQFK